MGKPLTANKSAALLEKENATLKRALELICEDCSVSCPAEWGAEDALCETCNSDDAKQHAKCQYDFYIRKAQLAELQNEENRAASETAVQKQPQMSEKALYCLGQHFTVFYEYCKRGLVADFAQPCAACKYLYACDLDWFKMACELEGVTGIRVHLTSNEGLALISKLGNGSGPNSRDRPHSRS